MQSFLWYNLIVKKSKYQQIYNTPYQLKLPLEISKKIKIYDPVYTFCEVFDHIDLKKYLAVKEDSYFALGDNRDISLDGRYWVNRYVRDDKIAGRVAIAFNGGPHKPQ